MLYFSETYLVESGQDMLGCSTGGASKKSRLSALYDSLTPNKALEKTATVRTEYQKYKSLLEVSDFNFDDNPLMFWKAHSHVLPHLSLLARSYLAMQATSCASERLFSQDGLIVTQFR
jgi:hypothetical protein